MTQEGGTVGGRYQGYRGSSTVAVLWKEVPWRYQVGAWRHRESTMTAAPWQYHDGGTVAVLWQYHEGVTVAVPLGL